MTSQLGPHVRDTLVVQMETIARYCENFIKGRKGGRRNFACDAAMHIVHIDRLKP